MQFKCTAAYERSTLVDLNCTDLLKTMRYDGLLNLSHNKKDRRLTHPTGMTLHFL
jgi:hypothetical protein